MTAILHRRHIYIYENISLNSS